MSLGRDRKLQATTKNLGDLVIGIAKGLISQKFDASTYPTDFKTAALLNAAHSGNGMQTLGALKNASLSMKPTFKEHKAGYPQKLDFKIAELLAATYKLEMEEIGSAHGLALLDQALDSLETGAPAYYAVESLSEFANGGTLSLFGSYCQLKPTLSLNFADDFASMPFEFEALVNPTFNGGAGNDLIYRTRASASARSISNQPMTEDVDNLGIGIMQVRIGRPSRRGTSAARTYPAKLVTLGGSVSVARPVVASSGTYTGTLDGQLILVITDNAANEVVANYWTPEDNYKYPSNPTGTVTFAATTPTLVAEGVYAAFSTVATAANAEGDIYVIGVETASAIDSNITGFATPFSHLTSVDRVGSCKNVSLDTNPTYKEHFSGYPKVRDMMMLESSTVTIAAGLEEVSMDTGALASGLATSLGDMVFDSSVNGKLYYLPVEVVMNLANGGAISFFLPNAQIAPESDFAPGNDWASLATKFEAQIQGASSLVRRIYRQAYVPTM